MPRMTPVSSVAARPLAATPDGLHGLLQRLQETRAIGARKAGVVALALAGLAQMAGEIAHGERHADAGLAEGLARGADDAGAGLQAAGGKGNVGGDGDIGLGYA